MSKGKIDEKSQNSHAGKPTKLLRPFTGTGAVFFPTGKPPKGSCYWASKACLQYCYAIEEVDINFDEDLRVTEVEKTAVKMYFINNGVEKICRKIIKELDGLQTPILHWFGTGDCPPDLRPKISSIIKTLPGDIVQMGFTRNRKLWKNHKDIFALTIEDETLATDLSALYSIPIYAEQTSVIYSPKYQVRGGYCGPLICTDVSRCTQGIDHYINCKTCLRLKTGCFHREEKDWHE